MCAISHTLEREGLQTTGISLVRENAAHLRPPRSLWVSFPLGRPLGKPNDAAFQHRVIAAALGLLTRPGGPVLEDFPEDAPAVEGEAAPACPVSFPRPDHTDTWQGRLAAEFALLKPWHELGRRRRRGRTLVGASEQAVQDNLQRLGELLDAGRLPADELKWFKLAMEDAKAYYIEALTAQPGEHDHQQVRNWLWQDTQLGAGLAVFHKWFRQDPKLSLFARLVAPRQAVGGSTGKEIGIEQALGGSTGEEISIEPNATESDP